MKLLITSPSPERGGVEAYALTLAKAAVQEGWNVHAAFPQTQGTTSLVHDFTQQGVSFHPQQIYPIEGSLLTGITQNLRRVRQAIALLRKVNPDVVLINLPLPVQSLDLILACAFLNIPTTVIFHSFPESLSFNPYKLRLYHWAKARTQQWVGVSQYNCKLICESFQLDRSQISCIYNGVKLNPNSEQIQTDYTNIRSQVRQELGLASNCQIVITVGRLDLKKGYGDLGTVIPNIVSEFPNTHFVWVGEGQHREILTRQIHQSGIAEHVSLLGYRSNVQDLLKSADLFVFPTHYEGMPFALLEAMVNRLPIISSDVSGIPEILAHQVQGLLFEGGNHDALSATLLWALRHPASMEIFALNAQQRVQAFSEDRMVQEILTTLSQAYS